MILKLCFWISSAVAAASAILVARGVIDGRLLPRLLARRARVEEAADLAGIDLNKNVLSLLSLGGPIACLAIGLWRRKRIARAAAQLPDALALLGNAMGSGFSLPQAIEMASLELSAPLGEELSRVAAALKLGRTVEEALLPLERRLPTEEFSLVVRSVSVLRRTGGNLIETFSTLAGTVEGRLGVDERIRVLTAEGVIQGAVLLAMPWLLCAALHFVSPDYLRPLFTTRVGFAFIAVGILLELAGGLWLRKIVMIRV